MKSILKKTLSLLLCMALTLPMPVFASEALGEDLSAIKTPLHQETQLSENVFWSTAFSNLRTEHFVTYAPNEMVTPIVTYGDTLTEKDTLSQAAATLEAQGYRVVAGINGDFFNTSNGLPIGLVIADGDVKSSDGSYHAIGFRGDGSSVIGKPTMRMELDMGYSVPDATGYETQVIRRLTGINKARVSTSGIYLYTYDFNNRHTTGTTAAGVDVVCNVDSKIKMNSSTTLTVEKVVEGGAPIVLKPNQVVLSSNVKAGSYDTDALRRCQVGSTITMTISANEAWNDVEYALGGLYSLVENGQVVSGLAAGAAPRTAVGVRADGSTVFYTIDGRNTAHSIGATMTQVAKRLVELGCVTAVCLDGGGSTMLTASGPVDQKATIVNKPSDGRERSVTNQIFLVAEGSATGKLNQLYIEPAHRSVLAGTDVALTVTGVDTNYFPMKTEYSLATSAGEVQGDVVTTPKEGGTVTITASHGESQGTTEITAIATPEHISLTRNGVAISALTIAPGDTVALGASAAHNHMKLHADLDAFTWKLDGNVGTLDATGKFSAITPGTGTITLSAGAASIAIPVNVTNLSLKTMEDFEGETTFKSQDAGMEFAPNRNIQQVKLGRVAGTFAYTVNADGVARMSANYAVSNLYPQLNVWVYGDSSGNSLEILTSNGEVETSTRIGLLDFEGWKQLSATLPEGATTVTGLSVVATTRDGVDEQGQPAYLNAKGTIGLDQMVMSYDGIVDSASPIIEGAISGGEAAPVEGNFRTITLKGQVTDDRDGLVVEKGIRVLLDGAPTAFTYDVKSGIVTATIALKDNNAHRITVEAIDASGNRNRKSWDVVSLATEAVFADTANHWAGDYVDFLKTAGVTNGYADGTFAPDKNISREEFAVMLYRYLGIDGNLYKDVVLPFADVAQIGDFAKNAIQALYSTGVLNGSVGSDGQLYFNPKSSLTRGQASAMIGRTQANGYPKAELNFSDAGEIGGYATEYVATMVAQGILGGFADGTFRPNQNITRGQMAKILYNSL